MKYNGRNLKPYHGFAVKKDWEVGAFGKAIPGTLRYYAYDVRGLVCKATTLIELKRQLDKLERK